MKQVKVTVNRDFRNQLMLQQTHQDSIRIESISKRNGDGIVFQFKFLDDINCLAEVNNIRRRPTRFRSYSELRDYVRNLLQC